MTLEYKLENKYYNYFMLLSIFGYALFDIVFPHLGTIFLGFILIGSLPLFTVHQNKIFKDPIVIILILVLIVEVLSWINSLVYFSEYADEIPKLDRLAKLFVFFFIAYWLRGSIKNVTLLWLFFIIGFLSAVAVNADIQSIFELGLNQPRVDFSIKNAQWDSMLSGTSLLMSLSFFYIITKSSKFSNQFKAILYIGTFLLVILFMYFVLITQSRQVWLGLLGVLIVGPISYLVINKIANFKVLLFTFLLTLGGLFLFFNSNIVQKRLSSEQSVMHSFFDKNKPIEMSSIGIRLNSWIEASKWIQCHPILGLDSEAIPEVIQQSPRFNDSLKKKYGHLHNFFIETLVIYGFIGFFLMLAVYYFVIKSIQISSISKDKQKYYLLLSICFTTYWIIINNFETYNSRHLGVFTHNIALAGFYTFYLSSYLQQEGSRTSS